MQRTNDYKIMYKRGKKKSNLFNFIYNEYARDLNDNKSTFSYVFMMKLGVT